MVAKFERTAIISYAHPVCKGKPFFALQDSAGLANFGAAEAVSGPSLGACAARGPRLEVVCGAHALAALACQSGGPSWHRPSPIGQFFGHGLG